MELVFKSKEEIARMSESEVMRYTSKLMRKKLDYAEKAINGCIESPEEYLEDSRRISEEMKLVSEVRSLKYGRVNQ